MMQLPEAFLHMMRDLLGEEEYPAFLASYECSPRTGLRVNRRKISAETFAEKMSLPVCSVPWIDNGFFCGDDGKISRHPWYYGGLYYIQEPSAMTPASLLPVEPGDRILDLCAAPGGKATELAAKREGRGFLLANDISVSRAKGLLRNLERFGIANMAVCSEHPRKLLARFAGYFDKVLVDAPCSGEGMFRRRPDMTADWQERGPVYYSVIQKELILQAADMLRPGGCMLYSTCTFSRREDEEIVQWILDAFPEMELAPIKPFEGASGGIGLEGCIRLFPHRIRGEGHFMALLRKQTVSVKGDKRTAGRGCGDGKKPGLAWESGVEPKSELEDFLKETKIPWDYSRIVKKNDMVYYLPEGFVEGTGLRFLRTGLWMGTMKKGRFEPSQAMAMVLGKELYSNCVSFDREDMRVVRYLKGETISLKEGEGPVKGWCLVCVDRFALGFGKGNGMTIKNKYYAGWRWQ